MKTFSVRIPVEGYIYVEVEAESESAAIQEVDGNTASYIL